jgi:hypothetical protein
LALDDTALISVVTLLRGAVLGTRRGTSFASRGSDVALCALVHDSLGRPWCRGARVFESASVNIPGSRIVREPGRGIARQRTAGVVRRPCSVPSQWRGVHPRRSGLHGRRCRDVQSRWFLQWPNPMHLQWRALDELSSFSCSVGLLLPSRFGRFGRFEGSQGRTRRERRWRRRKSRLTRRALFGGPTLRAHALVANSVFTPS